MATHSSILAWRIPWTEEPGRLQAMGSQGSDTTQQLSHQTTITVTANIYITVSGVQNELPLDVALLHEDYLELKVIETPQVQEKLLPSHSYLEEFILGIFPRGVINRDRFYLSGSISTAGQQLSNLQISALLVVL